MSTQTVTSAKAEQEQTGEAKVRQLRELFADAPEMARTALEHALPALTSQPSEAQASQMGSAGRIGIRQGTVSELTVIAPSRPAEPSGCARCCDC